MGVPERLPQIKELQSYFEDHKINPSLMIDNQYRGIWWNAKRAWKEAKAEYHMVIQDDALICNKDKFFENLSPIINYVRNNNDNYVISLYSYFWFPEELKDVKNGLVCFTRCGNAVGTIISRINIIKMLHWIDTYIPDTTAPHWDDERIAAWQTFNKIKTLLPIPMLIHHNEISQSTTSQGEKSSKLRVSRIHKYLQMGLFNFNGTQIDLNIFNKRSYKLDDQFNPLKAKQ